MGAEEECAIFTFLLFFKKKLFLYRWLALQTLKAAFNLGKKSTIMQSMLGIKWMSHLGSLVLGHTTKMQA